MFKNFANQLETGLKEPDDGLSLYGPAKKKMVKSDQTVSLPDIHKSPKADTGSGERSRRSSRKEGEGKSSSRKADTGSGDRKSGSNRSSKAEAKADEAPP